MRLFTVNAVRTGFSPRLVLEAADPHAKRFEKLSHVAPGIFVGEAALGIEQRGRRGDLYLGLQHSVGLGKDERLAQRMLTANRTAQSRAFFKTPGTP